MLKNTSPGRDMILCRLSGLDLEHTGIIAGMSGSPIYVDGKLIGAVAYAWSYGKDPIAGVTPFSQMLSFAEATERRSLVGRQNPIRVGLNEPLHIDGRKFHSVTVSQGDDGSNANDRDGLWMRPLRTPIATTGFSTNSLHCSATSSPTAA